MARNGRALRGDHEDQKTENQISKVLVDAAIEVHRTLGGPGLLESMYEEALTQEVRLRGLHVERQVPVTVMYEGVLLSVGFRTDMLVERKVIVECKATRKLDPAAEPQTLTYLRNRDLRLGLVINFGERPVRWGIRRVVNNLADDQTQQLMAVLRACPFGCLRLAVDVRESQLRSRRQLAPNEMFAGSSVPV
jgi:GxxExxY protein